MWRVFFVSFSLLEFGARVWWICTQWILNTKKTRIMKSAEKVIVLELRLQKQWVSRMVGRRTDAMISDGNIGRKCHDGISWKFIKHNQHFFGLFNFTTSIIFIKQSEWLHFFSRTMCRLHSRHQVAHYHLALWCDLMIFIETSSRWSDFNYLTQATYIANECVPRAHTWTRIEIIKWHCCKINTRWPS